MKMLFFLDHVLVYGAMQHDCTRCCEHGCCFQTWYKSTRLNSKTFHERMALFSKKETAIFETKMEPPIFLKHMVSYDHKNAYVLHALHRYTKLCSTIVRHAVSILLVFGPITMLQF